MKGLKSSKGVTPKLLNEFKIVFLEKFLSEKLQYRFFLSRKSFRSKSLKIFKTEAPVENLFGYVPLAETVTFLELHPDVKP
jgi:uncharacterized protein YpmS